MKQFVLINDEREITFNFPTSISELSSSYLKAVTQNVKVADNYILVGLVYRETLGRLILARKQSKKGITSGVTPIFVKAGNTDNEFIKSISIKDKLIIFSSQLALAQHVIVPNNSLSIDCFIKYLDKDVNVAARYNNNYGNEDCYLVEFKLVPACDILGFYASEPLILEDNPYLTITEEKD